MALNVKNGLTHKNKILNGDNMRCNDCYFRYCCDEQTEFICKHNDYCKYIKQPAREPMKIAFNYHSRGFYCPICLTGVKNKEQECPCCSQRLMDAYGFN